MARGVNLQNRHGTRHPTARRARRAGFTLIEMLVVIGILVIMLALAVPLFNVFTGNRSSEAAQNELSALLSQARAEAMGLQRKQGVFFYYDPKTERSTAVLVAQDPGSSYLELVPDREPHAFAVGVGIQVINDQQGDTTRDKYLRTSCILFDGHGQLVSVRFAIFKDSQLAQVLQLSPNTTCDPATPHELYSGFGVALYPLEAMRNQAGATDRFDLARIPFVGAPSSVNAGDEATEETWIGDNALLFLVNRYNGTLTKGE